MMKYGIMCRYLVYISFCLLPLLSEAQVPGVKLVKVDSGWANNSVNAVIFRKNSLVTSGNIQYIAYYDKDQFVVLGKRKTGDKHWQLKRTPYQGNTADAHNTISIMTDAAGYLHMTWDHHGNPLNYCRSKLPGSLEMSSKLPMTGLNEQKLTYPEFHKLPSGEIIFLFRDGQSGKGNLVINAYDSKAAKWTQLHNNLIDGEGKRSAYWQTCVDTKGTIHISWVWRESPDVASNHDMCYARSSDKGKTWTKSTGEIYQLPITAATAEYAARIPQKSELINQTSMFANPAGDPYIATYWREQGDSIPQYHIVYKAGDKWETMNTGFRKTPFSLSGAGTKRIPIARPQIIAWKKSGIASIAIIFRDAERGNKISVAICNETDRKKWKIKDLTQYSVGSWEPTYDTELWKQKNILNLFVQKVEQVDGEGKSNMAPQPVFVLEWNPKNND
jgi:hypothetical protein